jgi:Ca2+-binding RTX toxin-like protein
VDITITDPSQLTATLGTSGIDQVIYGGSGTVVLPDNIENVTLTGGNANARGNSLANAVRGSAGDNVLETMAGNDWVHSGSGGDTVDGGTGRDYVFGGTGNDLIQGASGNDTLYGYKDDDRVSGGSGNDLMSGSAGNDTVSGGSGHDNVHGGSGHDWVFGDAGRDTVSGGIGNDTVNGGAGNDTLYGNAGRDVFVFDTKLSKGSNVDTIKDFNVANDSLWLDDAIFTRLGTGTRAEPSALKSGSFVVGSWARDADDYLIYDRATGVLSYDADGSGAKAAVVFARLKKDLALTHKDFLIV